MDNAQRLQAIADRVAKCTACRLHEKAKNPVPGAGSPTADIVIIGEAPGEQEDLQGVPFVGRSGKYLDYLLDLIGLKRADVFIVNVAKHRPPDNRDPLPDEISACKPFLDEQLDILKPLIILTLGRFSMARYFPDAKISKIHGQPRYENGTAYYPLYHPAAALRNPSLRWDMEDDIKRIPAILAEVRKQRGLTTSDAPLSVDEPTPDDEPSIQKPEGDDDAPLRQLSLF